MVQKAVEMGVSRLHPVIMRHTQAERVKLDRMRANAIEAADQCRNPTIPEIVAPLEFAAAIAALGRRATWWFCDEEARAGDPVAALRAIWGSGWEERGARSADRPEGGFGAEERAILMRRPRTSRIALGPAHLCAQTRPP